MKSRRKAISAELVRESKDNPGYFRYNIEIEEVDGTRHKVPAYGKDMQDAIERLLWNERVDKVTKSKIMAPSFALLLLAIGTTIFLFKLISLYNLFNHTL